MDFHEYRGKLVRGLEGNSRLQRAYYIWPHGCGKIFFSLDQTIALCRDQWSEGAARVATEQGLQAPSPARAAQSYTRAIGKAISKDSVRRITRGLFPKGIMFAWGCWMG